MESAKAVLKELHNSRLPARAASLPVSPGIYGFFLDPGTCLPGFAAGGSLVYLGKAEDSLRTRALNKHLTAGRTGSSSLRRSLGAILREELKLIPTPRSTGAPPDKFKFTPDGERALTDWMMDHLEVGFWRAESDSKQLTNTETEVLRLTRPPLDLDRKTRHLNPKADALEALRKACSLMASETEPAMGLDLGGGR